MNNILKMGILFLFCALWHKGAAQFDSIYYHVVQPKCHTFEGILVIDSVVGSVGTTYYYSDSSNISNNPVRTDLYSGSHTVFVADSNGSLDSISFVVIDPPALSLDIILSEKIVNVGDYVKVDAILNIDPTALKNLSWRPPNIFRNDSIVLSQTVPLYETTNIALELVDTNNCIVRHNDTVFVNRSIVFFPNAIMVNSDLNAYFTAYTDVDVKLVNFLEIRDRWGKVMFVKDHFPPNDTYYSWNGRINGKPVSQGTYLYQAELEYQNGKKAIYKGEVTVLY